MGSLDPIAYGLPHRAPFIFVDEVREIQPGVAATCVKFFSADEPFFAGHFPGQPLVPGVILAEAMAQTAGIAAGQKGRSFRLSAIKQMKFLHPVLPESSVIFTAEKMAESGTLQQFRASASVEERLVAEGVLVLAEASL